MKWVAFLLSAAFVFAPGGMANSQPTTASPSPSPSASSLQSGSNDIGVQRIDAIFESAGVNADFFDPRLLEKLPLATIERQVALFKAIGGNYEGVTRSLVSSTDPRMAQLSHYVATFSVATADIYLHFDDAQKIDGIFLSPLRPKPTDDQGSQYITPPAGWKRAAVAESLSKIGLAEIFYAPESAMGFREDIGVFVVQSDSTSIKLALAKIEEILPMKDFKGVEKPRRCGRFEGAEITAEQPMPTGIVVNLYEVAVLANLKLYIAAYTRPMDAKDDDKAIQAVNSLCENPLFGGVASL